MSYKTLLDHSHKGTNDTVKKAKRLKQGSNICADTEQRELGAEGAVGLGRFEPARGAAKRPAITRRCALRAVWSGGVEWMEIE